MEVRRDLITSGESQSIHNKMVAVCDWENHAIRKISQSGNVTTVAGVPGVLGWNDGAGDVTRFNYPVGLAVSSSGQLYIADSFNNSIRTGVPQLRLTSAVSRKTHGAAALRYPDTSFGRTRRRMPEQRRKSHHRFYL